MLVLLFNLKLEYKSLSRRVIIFTNINVKFNKIISCYQWRSVVFWSGGAQFLSEKFS